MADKLEARAMERMADALKAHVPPTPEAAREAEEAMRRAAVWGALAGRLVKHG